MRPTQICKEELLFEGIWKTVECVRLGGVTLIIEGKLLRKARLQDEWYEEFTDPASALNELRRVDGKPDLLTFWQRLPETQPKYGYYMEWDSIAAIPIKGFDDWWNLRISSDTRNKIRKAPKKGIEIKVAEFSDDLLRGIMNIYNESPVKRGKPFRHYGKDFETVKREMSDAIDRADFIGAYYGGELVGFIKLNYTDRYAMMTMILSMTKHLNKFPNNALIAKAVEVCVENRVPFLTYTTWRRGDHGHFQHLNGFEKVNVPRYYVPLTTRGELCLKLRMHRGIVGVLPESVLTVLLDARRKWYSTRFGQLYRSSGAK